MTSAVLPLFPLRVVLFPGRPLPLHLFEPRYKKMLDDCEAADGRFGVVAIKSGAEVNDDPEVHTIGTVAQIEDVKRFEDGRADVAARGTERFRILELLRDRPYLRARVEPCPQTPANGQVREPARLLRRLLHPYLSGLGAPEELLARLPQQADELSWLAASAMQVDVIEQQGLLEIDSAQQRIAATVRILRRESCIMRHLGAVASLKPAGPGGAELN